jgi:hypothetical protein
MKTKQNIIQSIDLKTVESIRSTKTPMNNSNSNRNSNQKNTHNKNHQNQQHHNDDSYDDDDDDNNSHVYNSKSKQTNQKSKQNNTIGDFNHHHQNSHHKKPRTYHRMSLPIEAYPSTSSSMLQLNRQYHHKLFGSTFFDGFSFVISGTKSEEFK